LASNNGDTLGEAVISVKRNEFRSGHDKEKFDLKQQPENRTNIIIYYLFQRCFKRCKPITVSRSASHDFYDKIFNTVGMATAASRRP
jgi:hypothetical protein